jgi:hypothetical protein
MSRLGEKGSGWDVDQAIADAAQPGGPHTHPISDVTDLQPALDGKAASNHVHTYTGYALTVECLNQATTTDAQTIYWGSKNLAHQTVADIHRIYIPKAGTIKVCYAHFHAGTAGTAENWSLYIRLNNTTDTLVQTIGLSNANRVFSKTDLSIAVVAGDYIELKEIQPTWATNPANVRRSAVIYIE